MSNKIYNDLLSKKLNGKSAMVRYSSRNKICKDCVDRLKCVTRIQENCPIRKKVDSDLKRARRVFSVFE